MANNSTGAVTMEAGMTRNDRNGSSGSGFLGAAWSFCQYPSPMGARYIYGAIILIGNVLAWVVRENPKSFFLAQRRSGCQGDRDCLGSEAVLMISFSNFLFYSFMFISTLYTMTVHELRSSWHSGWWPVKIIVLLGCYMAPILLPDYFLQLYGKVAPFGAGLFLIIQLMSVIRYVTRLNSRWCGPNFDTHRRKVNTISILAYGLSMVGIIVMVFWYLSSYMDAALIVSTLVLVYVMPLISLITKAKGFYMEPLLMGLYIVFLCWSAIKSEPKTSSPKKEKTGSRLNWITIISFIGELASVTVAAFSTGTDYKCIQFTNTVESENDVPYGYGFFHFVFATGSMFFGMLFVGWEPHHAAFGKWSMDVGWSSAIVHLVNEGLAVIFFVVVVLARCYGIGWLQQLLAKVFGTGGQQLADESLATAPARSGMDNNGPPQESRVPEHEGIEMGNIRPLQESRTTTPEEIARDNNEPPQGPHATEPQAPVLGRQRGEITEEL